MSQPLISIINIQTPFLITCGTPRSMKNLYCLLRELFMVNRRVNAPGFPLWLQSQTKLIYVRLRNAGISGAIPDEWMSNISSQIRYLDLPNNQISGMLLFRFNFPNLYYIDLRTNQFDGRLQLSSTNAPTLEYLYLGYNYLNGTIPSSICTIQSIYCIALNNNQFSGKFLQEWGSWNSIGVVDVSNNFLSGSIPTSMGVPSSLQVLRMDNNHFSGDIPSSLQNLSTLDRLYLGGNNFTGSIPSWIGSKVSLLEVLQLRSNFLSGHIPIQLCTLSNLRILDLGHNNLSGTIPKCFLNLTSLVNDRGYWNSSSYCGHDLTAVTLKGRELEYEEECAQLLTCWRESIYNNRISPTKSLAVVIDKQSLVSYLIICNLESYKYIDQSIRIQSIFFSSWYQSKQKMLCFSGFSFSGRFFLWSSSCSFLPCRPPSLPSSSHVPTHRTSASHFARTPTVSSYCIHPATTTYSTPGAALYHCASNDA
ncbi:receptor-like protein EIX2 [Argentina anserina]|uniref:receptor-like protein EIX2 n=1 Tax=Argentina anserina TaxID=57926 RepID=UPI0021764F5F|nr:receptor-like protein EIX2 [Potentilla anserina]